MDTPVSLKRKGGRGESPRQPIDPSPARTLQRRCDEGRDARPSHPQASAAAGGGQGGTTGQGARGVYDSRCYLTRSYWREGHGLHVSIAGGNVVGDQPQRPLPSITSPLWQSGLSLPRLMYTTLRRPVLYETTCTVHTSLIMVPS